MRSAALRSLLLLAVLAIPQGADALPPNVRLDAPRPYGYVLGDVIKHQVTAEVEAAYVLDVATLPKPGPVNRWLVLRHLDWGQEAVGSKIRYRLNLEYQTFYAPLAVKNLSIPAFGLKFEGPAGSVESAVPAWVFTTAPIRELSVLREDGLESLRPDAEPQPLAVGQDWLLFWVCAVLALVSSAYLGYLNAWLPYGARGRPFAEASRKLRRWQTQPAEEAFTLTHQAFNQTLDNPLFADSLAAFFVQRPDYLPLRTEIEAFFQASYALFFGDDAKAVAAFPVERLERLCRACLRVERERI